MTEQRKQNFTLSRARQGRRRAAMLLAGAAPMWSAPAALILLGTAAPVLAQEWTSGRGGDGGAYRGNQAKGGVATRGAGAAGENVPVADGLLRGAGGGSAGAPGGAGGNVLADHVPISGGAGGSASDRRGRPGTVFLQAGGAGGGGGAHGYSDGTQAFSTAIGGMGGAGGDSEVGTGGGGGGGGFGVLLGVNQGSTDFNFASVTVAGGAGGAGGAALRTDAGFVGGDGGGGGAGLALFERYRFGPGAVIQNLVATGGAGGAGGRSDAERGGRGGAGGDGVEIGSDFTGLVTLQATQITGGTGGDGVGEEARKGAGGDGGAGLRGAGLAQLEVRAGSAILGGWGGVGGANAASGMGGAGIAAADGEVVRIEGQVSGGVGGANADTALGGKGGAGVEGKNLSIEIGHLGNVSGGVGRDGRAPAIRFTGGRNTLTINSDADGAFTRLDGGVRGASAEDTLVLKTTTRTGSQFDLNTLVPDYGGFGEIQKAGDDSLLLFGRTDSTASWRITAGTLKLDAGASLETANALYLAGEAESGNVTLDISATGDPARNATPGTTIPTLSGVGVIEMGAAPLTILQKEDYELIGTVRGSGTLRKAGDGTLSLVQDNDEGLDNFAGGIVVDAGELVLNGVNRAGTSMAVNAKLTLKGRLPELANLSGSEAGILTIATPGDPLTVKQNADGIFKGAIVGGSDVALAKLGDASLTLTGDLSNYAGAVTIADGTLALEGSASLEAAKKTVLTGGVLDMSGSSGAIITNITSSLGQSELRVGGASIAINQTSSDRFGGKITGSGEIRKTGDQILSLRGDLSDWSGLIAVEKGGLQITDLASDMRKGRFAISDGTLDLSTATLGATRIQGLSGSGGTITLGGKSLIITGADPAQRTLAQGSAITLAAAEAPQDTVFAGKLSGSVFSLIALNNSRLGIAGDARQFFGTIRLGSGATLDLLEGGVFGPSAGIDVGENATIQGGGGTGGIVTVYRGGILSGGQNGGTMKLGTLTLREGAETRVTLGEPGGGGDAIFDVSNALTLAGRLTIVNQPGYGAGVYHLFKTDGSLVNRDITLTNYLIDGNSARLQPLEKGLDLAVADERLQYWSGDGVNRGGDGVWDDTKTVLNGASSATPWAGDTLVFDGTPGTITVKGRQSFKTLEFLTSDYRLIAAEPQNATPPHALDLGAGGRLWAEGADTLATIDVPIIGSGALEKIGAGTIRLTGTNSYAGGTKISAGTLEVGADTALGAPEGGITLAGGTLRVTDDIVSARPVTIESDSIISVDADKRLQLINSLSGAGALVLRGAGALRLEAVNSYAGGTRIESGTLEVGADTALGDQYSRVILMHEAILHATIGFVSARAITLEGASGISARAMTLGGASGISARAQSLDSNSGISVAAGERLQLTNTLSGAGGLTVLGDGVLRLDGVNNYAGGTRIAAGTLEVGADTALGAPEGGVTLAGGTLRALDDFVSARPISIESDSGIAVEAGKRLQLTNNLSGAGGLTVSGDGVLRLDGVNSYAGGTRVAAGTLEVGADTALGAPEGGVTLAGGTLRATDDIVSARTVTIDSTSGISVDADKRLQLTNSLSGAGGLTVGGDGVLRLDGLNSYAGGTKISAGTLEVGADTALGAPEGGITLAGGTLRATDDIVSARTVTIDSTSGISVDAGKRLQLTNSLSGAGGLTVGGDGVLRLDGVNSYAGGTKISAGTLELGADTALGAPEGGITLAGGTLRATDDIISARTVTIDSTSGISVDAGKRLQLTNSLSGAGGLTVGGDGVLRLDGVNSYAGGTKISAGTLELGADTALGAPEGGITLAGGTLRALEDFVSARAIVIESDSGISVEAGKRLQLTNSLSGAGALTVGGDGVLRLDGINSHAGGTRISAGTLEVSADTALGAPDIGITLAGGTLRALEDFVSARPVTIESDSGIAVEAGKRLQLTNTLSGAGGLTVSGDGVLRLDGINSHAGGTRISAGTLEVGADTALGAPEGGITLAGGTLSVTEDIVLARPIAIESNSGISVDAGKRLQLTNSLSGAGGLTVGGDGVVRLDGVNSYAGGTRIATGTLEVGADTALGAPEGGITLAGGTLDVTEDMVTARAITLESDSTLLVESDKTLEVTNSLSGEGGLNLSGSGTLRITGRADYAGLTQFGYGATLELAGAESYRLGGSWTGFGGTVAMTGGGRLMLAGSGDFAGTLDIAKGTAALGDAQLGSMVAKVGALGRLEGSGTVGRLRMGAGGVVAPGGPGGFGTITAKTDILLGAGSRHLIRVNEAGESDRLTTKGRMVIEGNVMLEITDIQGARTGYKKAVPYNFVHADGGIYGTYAGVKQDYAYLTAKVTPSADFKDLTLLLVRNDRAGGSFAEGVRSGNARAAARAVDRLPQTHPIADAALFLRDAEPERAFSQLSGEIHAQANAALIERGRMVRDTVADHARDLSDRLADAGQGGPRVWMTGFGGWSRYRGDATAYGARVSGGGLLVGWDVPLSGTASLGLVGGYGRDRVEDRALAASARIESVHLGAYGTARLGALVLRGGAMTALQSIDTDRVLAVSTLQGQPSTSAGAMTSQGFVEAGWRLASGPIRIEPYGQLALGQAWRRRFTEQGGPGALVSPGDTRLQTSVTLGARATADLAALGLPVRIGGGLGWQHGFGPLAGRSRVAFADGAPFTIRSAALPRDGASTNVTVDVAVARGASLTLRHAATLRAGATDHNATARLAFRF
ncbi:autotransporter-associated beta strand repeat-containing protein [Sphingomonas morindae]|uniref:Autotransporter-associated beta strand repeat-containing protein n=1 Tax=Sphingomonas morindae TaxID=1541170 RepID=A0ABY4XCU3_9SPHN|nr:autotransporter-associated beta strand repeat-containing protein [Sphingomonas morindae]USI74799.1 autotransporter-associated beta strand repeat-containing protein [Sphingomonas morindae]